MILLLSDPEEPTDPQNPCDGVTCSSRGTCSKVGSTSYTCNCVAGFTGNDCEGKRNYVTVKHEVMRQKVREIVYYQEEKRW